MPLHNACKIIRTLAHYIDNVMPSQHKLHSICTSWQQLRATSQLERIYHVSTSISTAKQKVIPQFSMVSKVLKYGSVQSEHEKLLHISNIPSHMVINHHPSWNGGRVLLKNQREKVIQGVVGVLQESLTLAPYACFFRVTAQGVELENNV